MSARPSTPAPAVVVPPEAFSAPRCAARLGCAWLAGTLFGAGLEVAQMTDPRKVLAFLDVFGPWDPSLLFVMGAAVAVTALGFAMARRRPAPLLAAAFHRPEAQRIDTALLTGAALFGAGWGLAGYCPGPVLASLSFANPEAAWFVPAMLAGAWLQRWQQRRAYTRSGSSGGGPGSASAPDA